MTRSGARESAIKHDEALDGWLTPSEWCEALLEYAAEHEECDWHLRASGVPLVQRSGIQRDRSEDAAGSAELIE